MRFFRIFAIIAVVLLIAVFSANCRKDSLEQERIKYAKILYDDPPNIPYRIVEWDVSTHGLAHEYLTMSIILNEKWEKENMKGYMEWVFADNLYIHMIDIGFEKIYIMTGEMNKDVKIEFYVDKELNEWRAK